MCSGVAFCRSTTCPAHSSVNPRSLHHTNAPGCHGFSSFLIVRGLAAFAQATCMALIAKLRDATLVGTWFLAPRLRCAQLVLGAGGWHKRAVMVRIQHSAASHDLSTPVCMPRHQMMLFCLHHVVVLQAKYGVMMLEKLVLQYCPRGGSSAGMR